MRLLWCLALLIVGTHAQMDTKFCGKEKLPATIPVPEYSPDFSAIVESTDNHFQVKYNDMTLSTKYQILKVDQRFYNGRDQVFFFPGLDVFKESHYQKGRGRSCQSKPLNRFAVEKDFAIYRNPKTKKLFLPAMRYQTAFSKASSPVFIENATVRGIPAQRWHFCAYQNWTGDTISNDLYYSHTFQMPGSIAAVPLKMKSAVKSKGGTIDNFRYDYTKYVDSVHPHNPDLEVPSYMYCKGSEVANKDMPTPPFSFHFQAVQKDLGEISRDPRPKPSLKFVKETYSGMYGYQLFIRDQDESSPQGLTKSRERIIHEYTTGLQYTINLSTGLCDVGNINSEDADYLKQPDGLVVQKTPMQFFNIKDRKYQYIGKHYHFDREIETDVYTSLQNEKMTTWWFASKDFLSEMGYKDTTSMVPLRYREQSKTPDKATLIDIFQFQSEPTYDQLFPDISACFTPSREMYLEITFSGKYGMIYLENPGHFRSAFGTAMMDATQLLGLMRIARLRVEPADKDNTLVKFTLLDKALKTGNTLVGLDEQGNDVIWPKLKKRLDDKTFKFVIHNDFGTLKPKPVNYRQGLLDPTTFKGKKAAASSSSDSSGYSSGSMGGLAIGMLLLGLLLGFVGSKAGKKFLDRAPDISMQELGSGTS